MFRWDEATDVDIKDFSVRDTTSLNELLQQAASQYSQRMILQPPLQ